MTEESWTRTEWTRYWNAGGISHEVADAQKKWVNRVTLFTRKRGLKLRSMADFGCGPAIAVFNLAQMLPAALFCGFDISREVVRQNSKRAKAMGLDNVRFEAVHLPTVPSGLTFDLILCVATLHYVEDSLLALQNLFETVKPGGCLLFNYPNRYTMFWYRRNIDESAEGMMRRFALVMTEKNVLSKKEIEEALHAPCRNFWSEVGEATSRANPCLFVFKPQDPDRWD